MREKLTVKDIELNQPLQVKEPSPKKEKHGPFYVVLRTILMIMTVLKNIFMSLVLISCIGGFVLCTYVMAILEDLPPVDAFTIQDGLIEHSVIVDQNGQVLERLFGDLGMRSTIQFEEIGTELIDAIIAIEDKTFYEHAGFNYVRLVGAVVQSVESGDSIRGTSSITQQLAKNMYLTNERAIERKIREAYYAIFLERTLTKSQILEAYLNKINFGMQTNGVAAASRMYFSKDAKTLGLVESAILAGIPKAPSRFAPMKRIKKNEVGPDDIIIDETDQVYSLVFNKTAQDRYNTVIQQMYNNEMITEEEYQASFDLDISKYIHPNVNKTNEISSYFGDLVKEDVIKALSEKEKITDAQARELIYSRGYIIHSTIDFEMQQKLESVYKEPVLSDTFEESTLSAVKAFQEAYELKVDGIVGEETLQVLIDNTSLTWDDFTKKSYQRWMTHDDIVKLHDGLNQLGHLTNEHLFPSVVAMFNKEGNIVNDETLKVLMLEYDNVINKNEDLVIKKGQYYFDASDNLVLLKDHSLEFYQQSDRVQVVVKKLFTYKKGSEQPKYIDKKNFTAISGLVIYDGSDVLIDDAYKSKVDGDLIIDRNFLKDYPNFFVQDDEGNLLINKRNYIINTRGEIQPQSAFVVLDHTSGHIKAIVGGRDSFGKNIYNRALVPHQPGSSIKPIGPYTVAIDSKKYTAATVIDDVPTYLNRDTPGERWPINWYEESPFKYRGRKNLRQGIEDSLNVVTAKLANRIGVMSIIDHLKKLGISTIVEEDHNIAATALGGMTYGISPLELAAAYATYGNKGVYIEPISFTRVTDKYGNIILDNQPYSERVIDEQVAFILQDMMRTAVTRGYARKAQIRENNEGIPIAGKTGTTSDKRDALFIGYSPYYTGAIWFGNDVRLKMDEGSGIAAEFWQIVMEKLHEDLEDKNFVEPEGLVRASVDRVSGKLPSALSARDPQGSQIYTEIFLPGTVPRAVDDSHVEVKICLDSNKVATPYCTNTEMQVRRVRLDSNSSGMPIADQAYMVPGTCDIPEHQAEPLKQVTAVIRTSSDGVVSFIRDYNLLLKSGSMKFIPIGSVVSPDYNITLPSGEVVSGSSYRVEYITNPKSQEDALNPGE